jgi:hypothetical protein
LLLDVVPWGPDFKGKELGYERKWVGEEQWEPECWPRVEGERLAVEEGKKWWEDSGEWRMKDVQD